MQLAISARTVILSVLMTFGMSLLVSLMVSRKNKKIDMVEALKCAE
jgi:putative ABC transport system permease protein